MRGVLKISLIYFILVITSVNCNVIEKVNENVNVTVDDGGIIYFVTMNENNHDFSDDEDIKYALFKIVNVPTNFAPLIAFLPSSATFQYLAEQDSTDETSYIFYARQSFDYETQASLYRFNVQPDTQETIVINLSIINIDDEQPSLSPPQCSFEENTIFTKDTSNCSCIVQDPDGWLSKMTFEIVNGINDAENLFDFEFRDIPEDDVKEADVYITVLKELNYQEITFYLFDVRAKDGANHTTTPNELVRGVINVIDLPDTPPEWTRFFTSQQFYEQSDQTFYVTAIDGDYGINGPINYYVVWEDDEEANYISIDNNGTIQVKPIDRDKDDISTYSFEIMAVKEDYPDLETPLNITFFILDIDNNPPLVRWITDADSKNVTFPIDYDGDKSTEMSILENTDGTLDLVIFIRDIDTGENAKFTVELEDLEENSESYTDAFMIVPTAGYRTGEFQITVRNVKYLDYEVPEWVHISFNVLTKGTLDEDKQDRILVKINLIDYNDEIPQFNNTEFSVSINETAKKDDIITQILATDRDAEDKILTHSLIGSTYTSQVLGIEPDTGVIYVSADNAFDYDTVNPIFVQVRATDKANHTATVPLTINLLDVNNKAPTISVGDPINVDENQVTGIPLNSSITASDMDTTAELSAEIDWDASYVMKNSRRLDMDNETISQQVKFLTVDYSRVDETDDTNRDIEIKLIVNDNNPSETTPDFELFDSLFISLKVTDWMTDPEFMDRQNTSVIILISINDINDNTPYFPEANLPESERENRTVQEFASAGTSVSSIVAIDLDVGDTVTYECKPIESEYDGIEVNTDTGAFTVKNSDKIDADTDFKYYFNYSCTASDDNHTHTSEPMIVPFYILDFNNKIPSISIDDKVYVDEKSDPNTLVSKIGTDDKDRDIPFHTVACSWGVRTEVCTEKFLILDNEILVRNGGNDIDRDTGEPSYSCSLTCQDNPDWLQNDRNPNSNSTTITIVLNDINDFIPKVLTTELTTSETVKAKEEIGKILATDLDEGDNAEIDFSILSVEDSNQEDASDLFDIVTDDDYYVNLTHKQANLIALKDLRGAFGTYNVLIQVADKGVVPNIANYTVIVTVEKFNFDPPRFIFPNASGQSVLLLSSQTSFSPLILFRAEDSEFLQDFYASDSSESDVCERWDIDIDFEQTSPDGVTIFFISKTDTCTGQLQVNNRFDPESVLGTTYNLKLIATAKEGEPQAGEASYTTETNIIINFLDNNEKPYFECPSLEFKFREEKLDQSQELECEARYELDDDDRPIFYYLDPDTSDDIANIFDVDSLTGKITLKNVISYKEHEKLEFKIIASNDMSTDNYNPNALLTCTCTVIEINNHVPQWKQDQFFGAIMGGFAANTIVFTLEATDEDKIDQGKLTYVINGTVNAFGSGLGNIQQPFVVSQSGDVVLNFQVDSIMSGYFQFDVTVWDVQDDFGNGPHYNTTSVTIFIITNDNTVDFRFLNTIDEVQTQEYEMLRVISDIIGYDAYKQDIVKATESGVELSDRTIARLYFIDSTTIEPVEAISILRMVSNINTFSELVVEVRNATGLVLMSFPATGTSSENLEEVLKAWLVGVSVVLGALCLILLVTFVLKTRELNNRIKKLTTNKFGSQESGLNRLGISAPTTNKHAIEGSNPIFNVNSDDVKRDLSKFDEYDAHSIRSGDSDLIGIEDNPEFDYHPSAPSTHM